MKIGISKCFFCKCRYDGSKVNSDIVNLLSGRIDHVKICPEEEIGLSTPRETLRLVEVAEEISIIEPKTNNDYTNDISKVYDKYKDLDGFILKNRSPSCALTDSKIYKNERASKKGPGIFGGLVSNSHKPFSEDEGRLTNKDIRDFYLTKLFLFKRFKRAENLKDFFLKEELLLKSINQHQTNKLKNNLNSKEEVYSQLLNVVNRRGRKSNEIKVLRSIVDDLPLTVEQLKYFNFLINRYERNEATIGLLKGYVYSCALFLKNKDILASTYFNPFPKELDILNDSGKI